MMKDDAVQKGLMDELLVLEETLVEIYRRLKNDQTEFGIASRKYAAMRDMVTKYLGHSPYEPQANLDGLSPMAKGNDEIDLYGGFRFIYMPIGKAVVSALKESGEPLSLEEIVKWLQTGGVEREDNSLIRAVNAALIKTKGIEKTKGGKYSYKQGDIDPDDIPF
jgi:hypothetical protein